MFLAVLLAHFVCDLYLIFAVLDQVVVANHVSDGLLGLPDDEVLPSRW